MCVFVVQGFVTEDEGNGGVIDGCFSLCVCVCRVFIFAWLGKGKAGCQTKPAQQTQIVPACQPQATKDVKGKKDRSRMCLFVQMN